MPYPKGPDMLAAMLAASEEMLADATNEPSLAAMLAASREVLAEVKQSHVMPPRLALQLENKMLAEYQRSLATGAGAAEQREDLNFVAFVAPSIRNGTKSATEQLTWRLDELASEKVASPAGVIAPTLDQQKAEDDSEASSIAHSSADIAESHETAGPAAAGSDASPDVTNPNPNPSQQDVSPIERSEDIDVDEAPSIEREEVGSAAIAIYQFQPPVADSNRGKQAQPEGLKIGIENLRDETQFSIEGAKAEALAGRILSVRFPERDSTAMSVELDYSAPTPAATPSIEVAATSLAPALTPGPEQQVSAPLLPVIGEAEE